jgi:mannose/fructose/N-acetylgalactosamine-specific phosphotransferase system component IIC
MSPAAASRATGRDEVDQQYNADTPMTRFVADYDDDDDDDEPEHSGLGIASFAIACFAGFIEFVFIVWAGILETSTPGGMDENSPQAAIIGLGILGGILLCLVGFALGIAGLFQRDQKKTFPVLGLVIGLLVMVGTAGLFILGSLAD